NPVLAAEVHDIPDDQEVTGESQPLNYGELVFELAADEAVECLAPAPAHARISPEAQVAVRRFSGRERGVGEGVAQDGGGEGAALGECASISDRFWQIME